MQGALLEKPHLGPRKACKWPAAWSQTLWGTQTERTAPMCAVLPVMMPTAPQAIGLHFKTWHSLPFQKLSVYFHNMQHIM